MATVRFIGPEERWFETAVTGSQQMWRRGQVGFVPDANVAAFLATGKFERYERDPVFEQANQVVDATGQPLGGGGGGQLGTRMRRLQRVLQHAVHDIFDFSSYEVLKTPEVWTNTKKFYKGQGFTMPGVTSHWFMFRGVQNTGDYNFSETAVSTITNFTPDTTLDYATYRDTANRGVIYQFPAGKFPITKRHSLMQEDGVTPIVPVLSTSTPNTYPSGLAAQVRFSSAWFTTFGALTAADLTANQAQFMNRFNTPHGPNWDNFAGFMVPFSLGNTRNGSGTVNRSQQAPYVTFDCTASSLTLEMRRPTASVATGDPVCAGFLIVDGVAVDWQSLRQIDAPSAGYVNTTFLTLNFRDNRRRRVRWQPGPSEQSTVQGIYTSTDGLIIKPNSLEVYAAATSDSNWAGATPWPFDGGASNVPMCLGHALGLGKLIDTATGGRGHVNVWNDGVSAGNFGLAQTFIYNPQLFDSRNGGRDLVFYAMGQSGFDEDLTVMSNSRAVRIARFTEFFTTFSLYQPNAVLILVRRRFDGPNQPAWQMTVNAIGSLAVGDVITNKTPAQTPADVRSVNTTATITAIQGNNVQYYITPQQSIQAATGTNPARWDGGIGSPVVFGPGDPIIRGGPQITTVASTVAGRVTRWDQQRGLVQDAMPYNQAWQDCHDDMLTAIEAAGLEDDQWMVVSLDEAFEINGALTDWKFYADALSDPANLALSADSIHHWGHPQLAKYIAQKIRQAVSVEL